ncbi:L-seryl-tRNA(Sec) selenium transferase [Streptomyces zhaozhouensis]|uniref:L-seryl-tRNA(Sec) selenium transferase n=1 Tax=Streptomyces zhaozhouensis TaxID=1300267 RepID=A0A286E0B8_9ACTN|nr:L-seryl-tRNA(Sec) selenium transferase [Streptomyces zhaozhouensis]SOD64361.1 L-seryl-tRNA(Sec) selenium transferase [Streptomyces zhaozhouensis]
MTDARRRVPRTDVLLSDPRLAAAERTLGRALVRKAVVDAQERVRAGALSPESAAEAAVAALPRAATTLRPVVNATGVLVHTNLGRAPLSPAAVEALRVASGTTDVEFDLTSTAARRARRGRGALAALAGAVPRAEAVHVVNNNAAALALVATALAGGREIVVSRGELVEIGDGFRLPELLESTGARLVEVGTTNRTHLADYARALGPDTGCVLKIHPSNFITTGFVASVPVAQLATLGVPLVHDIGSGLLAPHPALPAEPDAATSLADGADLVTASGDKLLGGPQAGLLLGRRDLIERLRAHPLARALRVDKLTLAALEATLIGPPPPTRDALETPTAALAARAAALVDRLTSEGVAAEVRTSEARVGGGGAPEVVLPSAAVALPAALALPLRAGHPAVVGRLHGDRLLLDLRTVPEEDDPTLLAALLAAAPAPHATAPAPHTTGTGPHATGTAP